MSEGQERTPETELNVRRTDLRAPKIEIDSIIKIYKRGHIEVAALRGLSCKFYPGEITVIVGPSGCGKTTLLNLIGGLDRPNSGKIFVNGENICGYSDKMLEKYRRKKVGYVFQFMNLIPELNALENTELPLLLMGVPAKERNERVEELLKLVNIFDRAKHKPDELSGGEQQRVAIAAALANNPEVILCDEPTGELDSDSKIMIMEFLKGVIKKYPNKSIIVVTHDTELKKIADRLYYIRDGNISHELKKVDLQKQIERSDRIGEDKAIISEKFLRELRELQFLITNKIDKLEKEYK
ncbi:MAG: ABC transporter ATP-binding protein [Promethearchaeota archaeon]